MEKGENMNKNKSELTKVLEILEDLEILDKEFKYIDIKRKNKSLENIFTDLYSKLKIIKIIFEYDFVKASEGDYRNAIYTGLKFLDFYNNKIKIAFEYLYIQEYDYKNAFIIALFDKPVNIQEAKKEIKGLLNEN